MIIATLNLTRQSIMDSEDGKEILGMMKSHGLGEIKLPELLK
jgi:hypothetical protein